jgi:hypothetical protein
MTTTKWLKVAQLAQERKRELGHSKPMAQERLALAQEQQLLMTKPQHEVVSWLPLAWGLRGPRARLMQAWALAVAAIRHVGNGEQHWQ